MFTKDSKYLNKSVIFEGPLLDTEEARKVRLMLVWIDYKGAGNLQYNPPLTMPRIE